MPCQRECQKSNNLTRHLNINFARDEVFFYISLLSMHDHHEKMAFSLYSRAVMAKKCTKKRDTRVNEVVVLPIYPYRFFSVVVA